MVRHFAFDPGSEVIEDGHRDIVVMPEQDLGQLVFYLQTMLMDLAVSLLQRLDSLGQEIGTMAEIPSPRDFDASLPREVRARIHLRYAGRRLKLMGDLYLLAGAYDEASGSLVAASEETKATGDHLWHAGTQEALQLALAAKHHVALLGDDEHDRARKDLWAAVPLRLRDASTAYERTVMPRLAFQVQLQAAELCTRLLGDTGQAATALVLAWNGCGPLNVYEKLVVLSELVSRFEALGLLRKAALYRKRLVFHLTNLEETRAASQLMARLIQYYSRWPALLPAVLEQALALAEATHDHRLVIELALGRLACDPAVMSTSAQEACKTLIKACARKLKPSGLIVLQTIPDILMAECTASGTEGVRLVQPEPEGGGRQSPMVYMPQSRAAVRSSEVKRMLVIQDEPIPVRMALGNPFAFRLPIKNLRLADDQGCVSVDLVLEPLEKSHALTVFFTPRSTGPLTLSRLHFELFGIADMSMELGSPLLFQVHPAQPLLVIQQPPCPLDLFNGERKRIQLQMQQILPITPNYMQAVSCTGGASLTCPLSDNQVSLEIEGRLGETEASVCIEYARRDTEAESEPFLVRTLSISVPVSVRPALGLEQIAFEPSTALDCDEWCTALVTCVNGADVPLFIRTQVEEDDKGAAGHEDDDPVRSVVCGPFLTRRIAIPFRRIPVHCDPSLLTDQQVVELRNRSTPSDPSQAALDPLVVERFVLIERLKTDFVLNWRTADGRVGRLGIPEDLLDFDRVPLELIRAPPLSLRTEWRKQGDEGWKTISCPESSVISCQEPSAILPADCATELRFIATGVPSMPCCLELEPTVPGLCDPTEAIAIGGQLFKAMRGQESELRVLLVPLTRTLLVLHRHLRGLDDRRLLTSTSLTLRFV